MSLFKINFQVDVAEAVTFGVAHKRLLGVEGGTPRRSSDELIQEGISLLERASNGVIYAWGSDPALISPETSFQEPASVFDISDGVLKNRIVKVLEEDLGKSFVTYLGSRGPFNKDRFWLRVGDAVFPKVNNGEDAILVVAFPELIAEGNHGAIMSAFCESVRNYLQAGGESSICNFVEASGQKIHPSKRGFSFAKAIHCKSFPKDDIPALKHDIDLILNAMRGAKGSGDVSDLHYLNTKLVKIA